MQTIEHRNQFPALLNHMGLIGEAIEVGVYRGAFAKVMLDSWQGYAYHLVDPWAPVPGYVDPINDECGEANYEATLRLLGPDPRVHIHRDTSLAVADMMPPESHDFVYIDANHRFDAVVADVRAWYPKVRVGGILAGHDYRSTCRREDLLIEVKPAIDSLDICGLHVCRGEGYDPPASSWWFVKTGEDSPHL